MIVTKNGSIAGYCYTAMKKQDSVWRNLLVCRVSKGNTTTELMALFDVDEVKDDTIGVSWKGTFLTEIKSDDYYKYVWLTYAAQVASVDEYEEALNILGVQTKEGGE